MINRLSISNYKSIEELSINPKRVNIFIGEHNSGKSNILEALSWFSPNALDNEIFSQLFRYKNVGNFFYDFDGTRTVKVDTNKLALQIRYARNNNGALLSHFEGVIYETPKIELKKDWNTHIEGNAIKFFNLNVRDNRIDMGRGHFETQFKAYVFKRLNNFLINYFPFLNPPFGDNIPALLQSNQEWKKLVSDFFRSKGFRLIVKPTENEIEMAKDVNDELYSFPYATISDTMQRFIFLLLALETNNDSILVLDEPESNMFPFFVKDFAERIVENQTNQYFLATHNPYLLGSLLEKTPKSEIAVFIAKMENYSTKVIECNDEQIKELISSGSGAFFSLDNIIA